MRCDCIDRAVSWAFTKLGSAIGKTPGYFIVVPVLIAALLATGLQRMIYESDPEYLFSPTTGRGKVERGVIDDLFPMNLTSEFDIGRLTKIIPFARVIIEVKDDRSVLDKDVFDEVLEVDELVRNLTVTWDEQKWRYEDMCAKKKGKCFNNEILDIENRIDDISKGTDHLEYPIIWDESSFRVFFTGAFLGGVTTDGSRIVEDARAVSLFYFMDNSNRKMAERGALWEDAFVDMMNSIEFDKITLGVFTSRTLTQELEKNTQSVLPFFSLTIIIMLVFSVGTCMMMDWVRSKPWLGILGCLSSSIAVGAAFGLTVYTGLEFIGINLAAPFLMLGIGMDDTFVLLAAWRRTDPSKSVPERMAHAYGDAGVSITITSLTNFISFWIGVITPFPCVRIFCIYTSMAVLFTYIYHITFFGGCMALSGYAEERNLHALVCVPTMPKSLANDRSRCFRLFCTGGRNKDDPNNPTDNKEHTLMIFFRDRVGGFLSHLWVKILVIILFLGYLGVGLWGCTQVREGLEKHKLARLDSYSVNYYELEDAYFRKYPYRIQVTVNGTVNYADPEVQALMEEILQKFESSPYIASSDMTESWLRIYLRFFKNERATLFFQGFNMSQKADFIRGINKVFFKFSPTSYFKQDIVFNKEKTEIIASRFVLQAENIRDANTEKNMVLELRRIAESFPEVQVTVFHPYFIFFDQFILVRDTSIQAISVAAAVMMVISLMFIPSTSCALWVAFSIFSIEIGVCGYMTLWNVNLDSISMINLIMCIGFSVDYSAHITYAYITARKETANERMRTALHSLGMPILQGSASTILGIISLAFAPSYIFLVFFKTVFLVILFGALHGILLLPVLLSLSDSCCSRSSKKIPPKEISHPFFIQPKEGDIITVNGTKSNVLIPRSNYGTIAAEMEQGQKVTTWAQEIADKDLGIGTSEESSDGSWKANKEDFQRNGSTTELTSVGQLEDSPESRERENHTNPAFVPDEDVENGLGPSRASGLDRMQGYHVNNAVPRRWDSNGSQVPPTVVSQSENRNINGPLGRYMSRLNSGYVREFQLPL